MPLEDGACSYTYGRQIWCEGHSKFSERQLFQKYFPGTSRVPQEGFFCNNANSALSKEIWARYRFHEDVTGLEDMELAKRLWADGEKVGYVAEAVVEHIRSEEHTSELQSLMRISYADFCLNKKN